MDYDEWQVALSKDFFTFDESYEPVIMFLDDEEISRICSGHSEPVEALCLAVLAELRQTDGPTIFDHIFRRLAIWRRGAQSQPPPFLPLLALTVLAGSRMRNDGDFSSAAYYPRLTGLLNSGTNSLKASGVQKHFDDVAEMWKVLDSWIEKNQNHLGPSTIRTHDTFKRIGYPLSQTMLKASDRERLLAFLGRIPAERRFKLSTDELLHLLRLWMDRPRGFSTAFVDLILKGSGNPLLLSVIAKLAAEPVSTIAVAENRVPLDLSLCIDPADWSIKWVIPLDSRVEFDELKEDKSSFFSIRKSDYGSTYDLEGRLPDAEHLISRHFRAVGARAIVTKTRRQLWILRMNPSSGCWQSVNNFIPYAQHLLVVQRADSDEIHDILVGNAVPGYWKFRGVLFPGWDVYVDVAFEEPIELSAAGSLVSIGQLLKTVPSALPKLANGLELRTIVGGKHYLVGGEPDVQLPEAASEELVQIVLDGRLPGTRVKLNGSFFPLRLAGPYIEGKHVVTVGGHSLEFFVHKSDSSALLGRELDRNFNDAEVTSSVLSIKTHEYVLCRRGSNATIWFIDPSGRVSRSQEIPDSSLTPRLGFPTSYQWKSAIPQGTSWILIERAASFSRPRQITTDRPNFGFLDGVSRAFWRRAASETIGSSDNAWRSYLKHYIEEGINGR